MGQAGAIHEAADGLVVSHPEILGGTPVFKGTRVPVKALFDYIADGLSLDYFLETFPSVSREQAAGVLREGRSSIYQPPASINHHRSSIIDHPSSIIDHPSLTTLTPELTPADGLPDGSHPHKTPENIDG